MNAAFVWSRGPESAVQLSTLDLFFFFLIAEPPLKVSRHSAHSRQGRITEMRRVCRDHALFMDVPPDDEAPARYSAVEIIGAGCLMCSP